MCHPLGEAECQSHVRLKLFRRNIPPLLPIAPELTVKKTAAIPFAGSQLGESRHVCAFFNNDDEAYRVLLPFIRDGFACNH